MVLPETSAMAVVVSSVARSEAWPRPFPSIETSFLQAEPPTIHDSTILQAYETLVTNHFNT